ncbi:hypothetical protein GCM10017744_014290 [Streptomyces antimycoticus]
MHSYRIRTATPDDLDAARRVMLDIVYRDFGTGYVPRWHADIIDPAAAYLNGARHTLLVAVDESDGAVVATAALDSRGPAHPPNPPWLAARYPSGETAQLRRVYVRSEHRRNGLARRLVHALLDFAVADGGYRAVYLHTDPGWWAPSRSGGRWGRSSAMSGRRPGAVRESSTSRSPWGRGALTFMEMIII